MIDTKMKKSNLRRQKGETPQTVSAKSGRIKFANETLTAKGTLVILLAGGTQAELRLGPQARAVDKKAGGVLKRAIATEKFTGKKGTRVVIVAPHNSDYDRVVLLGLGTAKDLITRDFEFLGGTAVAAAQGSRGVQILLEGAIVEPEKLARLALGVQLRGYKFDKYKSKKSKESAPALPREITIRCANAVRARTEWRDLSHIADGMIFARELVNEPANVLTPSEFAMRAKGLEKLGVKVRVLGETQMRKEKMHALLGVGQGSAHSSRLVVMEYHGAASSVRPLGFIGKGVCFDAGGISLKPAAGMEEMKGDMGGAAAVCGLMHSLVARGARVNAVGVIGLVENMPDGKAQRPGDIVVSMSGQTIEVLNTDAEGRLVLADALTYIQKHFKPQIMIDLATLTGAILVALGKEYAGLFSNNDVLATRLTEVGAAEGELLWRMPLCDVFDKMINTPNADMKNIGGRYAGSSTAAQFLQRFVDGVDWAHLDIAGVAMGSAKNAIQQGWASGYGVKLLDRFVHAHYEA